MPKIKSASGPAPALAGRQAMDAQGQQAEIQEPGQAQERQRSPFTDLGPSHGGRAKQELERGPRPYGLSSSARPHAIPSRPSRVTTRSLFGSRARVGPRAQTRSRIAIQISSTPAPASTPPCKFTHTAKMIGKTQSEASPSSRGPFEDQKLDQEKEVSENLRPDRS